MPTITEYTVTLNADGTEAVEIGNVLVTHDSDGRDVLMCDTDAGMLELQLPDAADLHRALGVMLERADPNHVMRQRLLTDFEERRAHAAASVYGRDGIAAQLAAADSGVWQADRTEVAVWRRALQIAGDVA